MRLILIRDDDDYINAVLSAPEGMDDHTADNLIADAIDTAKDDEEWDYGDVCAILRKRGFTAHEFREIAE